MSDYAPLQTSWRRHASPPPAADDRSAALTAPTKPPRLMTTPLPVIAVTGPPPAPSPAHTAVTGPPSPAHTDVTGTAAAAARTDALKPSGSFDSLDSETMVSVGSMADLDNLLAELRTGIGAGGTSAGGAACRGDGGAASGSGRSTPALTQQQPVQSKPALYAEPVRDHSAGVRQLQGAPAGPRGPGAGAGGLSELDQLLHDLDGARHTDMPDATRADTTVALQSDVWGPAAGTTAQFDYVPSPNAKTYETRTVEVTESVPDGRQVSSATQELDDLMASLSDFTIHATSFQRTVVEEQHAPAEPPVEKLDSMLGNLQADLSRQGVDTANKGICAACDMPIAGQVITALGKTWHAEHFTCAHCGRELGTSNFFERDGKPYCEDDYHELFSPRCAACRGPILDKCVTALERTWHPEHFVCAECGLPFGEGGFHERDGRAYCRDDYFRLFAPRCGGCQAPVMENYISALNAQWHPDCFVCKDCQRTFENGSFFEYEGQPYCETHYHAKRGSLCASCHQPITGRCVTAMFKKFHPEHFSCSFCLKQLNKGTFKEQEDKPYCHQCFDKLFG